MIVSNKILTKSRKISSASKAISKKSKNSNARIKIASQASKALLTAIANRNKISAEQAR